MTDTQLKELRELACGMSVANLNPEDVRDYMDIASACARMESRRASRRVDHQESNACIERTQKLQEGTPA